MRQSTLKNTILVTGGTGFIGRHLVRELALLDPNANVRVLSRRAHCAKIFDQIPNVECVVGDLLDPSPVGRHLEDVASVFHLAGIKGEPSSAKPHGLFWRTNVDATRALLDMSEASGVSLFVYMSSTGVFGKTSDRHCTEQTLCMPRNLYERTKYAAESIVRDHVDTSLFRSLIFRPSNVFGEDDPRRLLLTLMRSILSGSFGLLRKKNAMVNYVYVRDVSHVVANLARKMTTSGTYIINETTTLASFIELICKNLKNPGKVRKYPYFPTLLAAAGLDIANSIIGIRFPLTLSKLRALSNEQVFISERVKDVCPEYPIWGLEKGLKRTIKYYKAQNCL